MQGRGAAAAKRRRASVRRSAPHSCRDLVPGARVSRRASYAPRSDVRARLPPKKIGWFG